MDTWSVLAVAFSIIAILALIIYVFYAPKIVGPTGPQGPTGPRGVTGPTGAKAVALTGDDAKIHLSGHVIANNMKGPFETKVFSFDCEGGTYMFSGVMSSYGSDRNGYRKLHFYTYEQELDKTIDIGDVEFHFKPIASNEKQHVMTTATSIIRLPKANIFCKFITPSEILSNNDDIFSANIVRLS
jgi:hypothetical protein